MTILPRLGLSRRRHLPCVWFNKRSFMPHEFFRLLRHGLQWTAEKNGGDAKLIHKNGTVFYAWMPYAELLLNEWIEWEKGYKPPFDLEGKTVLDVGAGCGETALYYFLKGAEKVICIENNPVCLPYLEKNREVNGWDMEICAEPFSLDHLKQEFDLCKMDIEGGENDLLQLNRISFPLCIEVHGKPLQKAFAELGFRTIVKWWNRDPVIMNNYGDGI